MKTSAGILLYRFHGKRMEVFLVHPGGPFWKNKDEGAWSIPKGEYSEGEDALQAAIREFNEETGVSVSGEFVELQTVKLRSGKWVKAWALENDIDATKIKSNTFLLEWPPRSGKKIEVPEIDRAEWFELAEAKRKINTGQLMLVEELSQRLGTSK